ncbi:hypothetical protein WUBG_16723, partial [Wuchereria bancrofti]
SFKNQNIVRRHTLVIIIIVIIAQQLVVFSDYNCPSQNWVGHLAVLEYFIILKLICWPILFALFSKTAKAVDNEADKIWKYQLYSLVEDL